MPEFGDLVYRELLLCHAKRKAASWTDNSVSFAFSLKTMRTHTHTRMLLASALTKAKPRILLWVAMKGSELASLLPTDVRHWWPIIEDVFTSRQ